MNRGQMQEVVEINDFLNSMLDLGKKLAIATGAFCAIATGLFASVRHEIAQSPVKFFFLALLILLIGGLLGAMVATLFVRRNVRKQLQAREDALKDLEESKALEMQRLEQRHAKELDSIKAEHASEIERIRSEYEKQLAELSKPRKSEETPEQKHERMLKDACADINGLSEYGTLMLCDLLEIDDAVTVEFSEREAFTGTISSRLLEIKPTRNGKLSVRASALAREAAPLAFADE